MNAPIQPLISFCIFTYNRIATLIELLNRLIPQVESVGGGKYQIVVLDNASTDQTESVMTALAARFSFIKYRRNPENIGLIGNYLAAVRAADASYVWPFGDDDNLEDGALARVLEFVERANPDLVYLSTREVVRGENRVMRRQIVPRDSDVKFNNIEDMILDLGYGCALMLTSSFVYRKSVLDNVDVDGIMGIDDLIGHIELLPEAFQNKDCRAMAAPVVIHFQPPGGARWARDWEDGHDSTNLYVTSIALVKRIARLRSKKILSEDYWRKATAPYRSHTAGGVCEYTISLASDMVLQIAEAVEENTNRQRRLSDEDWDIVTAELDSSGDTRVIDKIRELRAYEKLRCKVRKVELSGAFRRNLP